MQTYLFYDIETTGLNKAFDQILQFAAIRTDMNLNELERYELKIKLNPDTIPSPGALLVHGISIKDTLKGETEYNAIKQIHQWLNQPGTISLGYNSLNFDDEFLRFSFYRNLLPPYTHQYINQCGRMDIYPMAIMYFLFKKSCLQWPEQNGKISLKLETLNTANAFVKGRAHHAMTDVEITLALAKCFFEEQEMWRYLQSYFNKQQDQDRIRELAGQEALLIDSQLGYEQRYQSPVYYLGPHRHYKNQGVWLRLDTNEMKADDLITNTRVKNKKPGELGFILPFKDRFTTHLSDERLKLTMQNKSWLKNHPDALKSITEHFTNYTYPVYPNTDADARLYLHGFWSTEEENICRAFHAAAPSQKARLLENIQNPLLAELALRIVGRHFPETLSTRQAEHFSAYQHKINPENPDHALIDFKGEKRLTPGAAVAEIDALIAKGQLSPSQVSLLEELKNYCVSIINHGVASRT